MCAPGTELAELPGWAAELVGRTADCGEDVAAALELSRTYGTRLPLPGGGSTAVRWAVLAAVARADLTVARVLEAHTDALAILAEAGAERPDDRTWGVFAAEAPGLRLEAREDGAGGALTLTGTKPWCSLGGHLDAALLTAYVGDERQLFAVDLRDRGVVAEPAGTWVARGLRTVTSASVHFTATPARPVGAPGWYLSRPGFAWGGLGVAACWHGGAAGVAADVRRAAARRTGELNALHVGIIDSALHGSLTCLADAARRIDAGAADGADGAVLALRVRAVVAAAAERILTQAGHALGPAALAFDEEHARRTADLGLYIRQHHAERDLAALGSALLDADRDAGP